MGVDFELIDAPVEHPKRPGPISFFVPGCPAPGGSKRGFALKKGGVYTGRVAIMDDAGQRNKNWRASVVMAAHAIRPPELLRCALRVGMTFYMPRPRGHYGSGKKAGVLKDSAPMYPTKKPDVLKIARSTEDALTSVIWADDCQSIVLDLAKYYGERPGCMITISQL